mmetsp:Transcript_9731/g.36197  ORF Transcript_9731/g.36197 Transcript_9731/m.36197 type:complete len:142 (-) Transcript_9731:1919-2344(-)
MRRSSLSPARTPQSSPGGLSLTPSSPGSTLARTISLAKPKQVPTRRQLPPSQDEDFCLHESLSLNSLLANKSNELAQFKMENGSPHGSYTTPARFQNYVTRKREGRRTTTANGRYSASDSPTRTLAGGSPRLSKFNVSFNQ